MKPLVLTTLAVLSLMARPLSAQTAASARSAVPIQVKAVSLRVSRPTDMSDRAKGFPFGPGLSLGLTIISADRNIIGVNSAASKLITFRDDTGTNLAGYFKHGNEWLDSFPWILQDGHEADFRLETGYLPSQTATKIIIKATVALLCSSQIKTATVRNVRLQAGTQLAAGPIRMWIDGIRPSFDRSGHDVVFKSRQPFFVYLVKNIRFFGPDGKLIGSTWKGVGGPVVETDGLGVVKRGDTSDTTYMLRKRVDHATIEVSYYDNVETVPVGIDINVGVGL